MSRIIVLVLAVIALTISSFGFTHASSHGQARNPVLIAAKDSEVVDFNLNSHIYHNPRFSAALRCTHCIKITRAEAKQRGGRACKLCGGGEWD
jgi:hypothetical protein